MLHRLLLLLSCWVLLFSTSHVLAQDCSTPFLPSDFKAKRAWFSNLGSVATNSTPIVANLNPQEDDMPEIIVSWTKGLGPSNPWITNKLEIYRGDGSNFYFPMVLTIPGAFQQTIQGPIVGDINKDGIPELLIFCDDWRIRVFRGYKEDLTEPMTLWVTSPTIDSTTLATLGYRDIRISLADFDGDGIPEVYTGSDIFSFDFSKPASPVLTQVIAGPFFQGRTIYGDYGHGACSPVAVDILSVADCNGDPDCAGLELVAGPVIYSIDLDPNDGDGIEIKIQRNLNQLQSSNIYEDGYTSVGDLDLDGVLDIAVSGRRDSTERGVYAWNKNGLLQFFPFPINDRRSGSLPCIANVYKDDGSGLDFPEILVSSHGHFNCFNLNAAQKNPATPYWWSMPVPAPSGFSNGIRAATVFDFNGDGLSEIVLKDLLFLKIMYGGPAPFPPGVDAERNWYTAQCRSWGGDGYPVVADVDNDCEAEIVVAGSFTHSNDIGHLQVFESGGSPWAPCRNVWNQYNYMAINVNDDLSIPSPQMPDHHLELPGAGSGKRPFNNYLVQRPSFNEDFEVATPLPDATIQVKKVVCSTTTYTLELNICNIGNKVIMTGMPVAFYQTDPTTTAAILVSAVQTINMPLKPGACTTISLTLPKTIANVYCVVNDDGSKPRPYQFTTDFPITTQMECNWLNNSVVFDIQNTSLPPALGPDLIICEDTLVTLNAGPDYATYRWQDGSTNSTLQVKLPGLYWVETTDFCLQKRSDTVRVEQLERPDIQLDTINGDCFGSPSSVTATGSSIHLPLIYKWSTGQATTSLSGLPDGTYTVTVTNAKGCSSTQSTWVEAGGNLQVSAAATPISCFGQSTTIQLNFAAGKLPYTYQWSDGSTAPSLPNAPAGNHSVTVTDADFCTQILQISLAQPSALTSAGILPQPACPGEANGTAAFLGASQGTPPYTLRWSNAATASNLTGLTAGVYTLTITDTNGCELVETVQVPDFLPPTAQATTTDVSCFGATNGSLEVALTGGSPGFGYAWSNFSAQPKIENLAPGTYTLTLTYADGKCAQIFDYQVKEPLSLVVSAASSPAICNGGLNGSIDLTVQNGIAPLAFLWSNGTVSEDLANVKADTYQVTVTDAMGCSETFSQLIAELPGIALSVASQQVKCAGGADGSIQISPSGGTLPFLFAWSDGSVAASIAAQTAGVYTCTVTDAAACTQVLTVSLSEPPALTSAGILPQPACPGEATGAAAFLGAAQGTPPYTLRWSNNETVPNLTSLAAGPYSLTITDTNGCELVETVEVPDFLSPTAQATTANVSCFGKTDGSVAVALTGGSPGFGYAWSNLSAQPKIEILAPGTYTLTLTYANGKCAQTFDFQVNQPLPVLLSSTVVPVPCNGSLSGSIDLTVQNGIAPLTFLWSTTATTEDLSGLNAGIYTVTVTDAAACTEVAMINIAEPNALVSAGMIVEPTCPSAANGGATFLGATQGTPPYTLRWSNNETVPNLTGLAAGTYSLTITDTNGCELVETVQVPDFLPPTAQATTTNVSCFGKTNGSVAVALTGGSPGFGYAWSNFSAQPKIENLTPGTYTLTVTYADGKCAQTFDYQVKEPLPVLLSSAVVQVPCAGGVSGSIDLTVQNGVAPLAFLWSNTATSEDLSSLVAGIYTVTVTDANACIEAATINVAEPNALLSAGILAVSACPGTANGTASFLGASQGTPPYDLLWSNNFTTPSLSDLGAGTYLLTVTDANGCSLIETVQVPEFSTPTVAATVADISCFGGTDGSVAVALTGGSPGFGYTWSNQSGQPKIENLTPGTYTLTLTYADGKCSQMFDFQVKQPTALAVLDPAVTAVKCFGGATGAIAVSSAGGVPPYQFTWSSGQKTEDITQVAAGNYTLTLTDFNGCTFVTPFEITQPDALAVSAAIQADTCQSASGTIVTTAAGGVQPYQFAWSNLASDPNLSNLAAGAYTLTLTDANVCTKSLVLNILAFGEIPQLATFTDSITCAHSAAQIGVSANQSNLNYAWSGPSGPLSNQAAHSVVVGGLYQVTVTNVSGCQSDAQIQVLEDKALPVVEAGPSSIKVPCSETKILLNATGSSQGGIFQNRWTRLPNGLDTAAVVVPIFESGLYVHTVLNTANGCSAQDSILVDWDEPIRASVSVEPIRCFGYDDGEIFILNVTGGKPPLRYSVDNLNFTTQNNFSGLPPGNYPVRVEDGFGCWWQTSVVLTQPDSLAVQLTTSDTSIELGRYLNLTALPLPKGTQWNDIVWGPSGLEYVPKSLNQKVKPEAHTEFVVQIFDQNGCVAEDRVLVKVHNYGIYTPNAILPGSNENGQFTIFAGEGVSEVRMLRVFDRWGELVFERQGFAPNDPAAGWDGSFRGQPLGPAVFWWYAEVVVQGGEVMLLKGDVTVVR